MDDIFDSLIEPIEYEPELGKNFTQKNIKKEDAIPDQYREYLFGDSNNIFDKKIKINPQKTNTKPEYWKLKYSQLKNKIKDKILGSHKYANNPIGRCLSGASEFDEIELEYYKRIYDLCDILITLYPQYLKNFISDLLYMNVIHNKTHIYIRIIFYLYTYLLKYFENNHDIQKLAAAMINKLNEFEEVSNIENFFTKDELHNYRIYYNRYLKS